MSYKKHAIMLCLLVLSLVYYVYDTQRVDAINAKIAEQRLLQEKALADHEPFVCPPPIDIHVQPTPNVT